jgi:hypothetical protein
VVQAPAQGGIAVERCMIAEQLAGAGEQHGMAEDHGLMGDVARERRFADPVGADQDDVGGLLEEVEGHQGFEGRAITAFGPTPIEVTDRFEAADMSGTQAPLQAAASALLLLPVEQHAEPFGGGGFRPVR